MVFLSPGFLFLLLATPLLWASKNARQNLTHSVLRILATVLVIIALARPAQVSHSETQHFVFIADQSTSISPSDQALVEATYQNLRERLPASAKLQRLDFGSNTASPLGTALSLANTMIPRDEPGCVILATDGAATSKDWYSTSSLSQRGIPVHYVALAGGNSDPRIVGLSHSQEFRVGHAVDFSLRLEGRSKSVRVGLYAKSTDTLLVLSELFALDGAKTVHLKFEATEAGFLELEARLEVHQGKNLLRSNDSWRQTFAVQDPTPVLYLGQRVLDGMAKLSQVVGPGFSFASGMDLQHLNPQDYALVILDDRPAQSVPLEFQQRLHEAVTEKGVGLLMSGGLGSFGPGGWAETPIENLLPVEFVQKEEKRDPSTTLVVIIDTSGSMGGNRVQLAKEVARLAIHRLLPHDKAGIVEFYGAKHWAAPIQPASNVIELERALNRMSAGGGTVILPAIEEAFYAMQNVQTRYKHVLVLTDGGVESGDFEGLLRNMSDKGITTSTVLIGSQAHSEFLVNMANWGKGRFYNVPNRFNLPEVILKQPASAKLPSYRPGSHEVAGHGGTAWWAGTDFHSIPDLDGYVETRARAGAEVLLETVRGGHPIIASWRYGFGRVSALTTEPVGPGTRNWQSWEGLGAFLAQLLSRTALDHNSNFFFQAKRQGVEVVLSARRRHPSTAWPQVHVSDDNLELEPIFVQRAPGYFEARFFLAPQIQLHLEASDSLSPTHITRLVLDSFSDQAPELQVDSRNFMPIQQLADATGGKALNLTAVTPGTSLGSAVRLREYAPWLLGCGLLLFLTELYYRRRPSFPGVRT